MNVLHNLPAEQALLGAVVLDAVTIDLIGATVTAGDFFDPVHVAIFDVAASLARGGQTVDAVTVGARMAGHEGLSQLGGDRYLATLVLAACDQAAVTDYATLIAELAQKRAMVAAADALRDCLLNQPGQSCTDILAGHEATLAEIGLARGKAGGGWAGTLAQKRLARLACPETEAQRVAFGIQEMDALFGGLPSGRLMVIGGRPGMGKSAVSLQIAVNLASAGHGVSFFSMDMEGDDVTDRLLAMTCNGSRVTSSEIASGTALRNWPQVLAEAADRLSALPIVIDDRRGRTLSDVASTIRRQRIQLARRGTALRVVILDHLHKLKPDRQFKSLYEQLTDQVRRIKDLAKQLDVAIILCTQLSRNIDQRDDKRPMMSDLRDTGAIEEEAELIALLYREEYYLEQSKPTDPDKLEAWQGKRDKAKDRLEVIAPKVRQGRRGSCTLFADMAVNRVCSLQLPDIPGLP